MAEFRSRTGTPVVPKSPVHLFELLTSRSSNVKYLWAHQQAILDSYASDYVKCADVALELPTGSGKTLVGMLIAEYRRRVLGERVAFLCPTRQLADQVSEQATKYGIPAVMLVGKQTDYNKNDFLKYESARAVAVTTYSGVFNSNPKIDTPQTLICDDAHAASDFIASMWSLSLRADENGAVFHEVMQLLADVVPTNANPQIIVDDLGNTGRYVDAISPILFRDFIPALTHLLDVRTARSSLRHPWAQIRDHLDACTIYCSPRSLEIRPVIPPTQMHVPFESAVQRVYMSATLGEDGDLERSFGVGSIARIPAPPGDWPERSTGRRLLMFPGMGTAVDPVETAIQLASEVGKVLVLTANRAKQVRMCDRLEAEGFTVLGADAADDAVREFADTPGRVALVLANRYDGIDLPGDVCRLEIIDGLPRAMSLQETFMLDRLNATAELRDRIRTRVTQALGRCTRDEADYAVVIALGDDLMKWAANTTNRSGMRTGLQAEFEQGMTESENRQGAEIVDLCNQFLSNSDVRSSVESAVLEAKESLARRPDKCAAALATSVGAEIDFTYAMWEADYDAAHGHASRVIDSLEGGRDLRPYLCLWFHQAAVAAYYQWKTCGNDLYRTLCANHIEDALATSRGVRWYSRIKSMLEGQPNLEAGTRGAVAPWFERIDAQLSKLMTRGSKYATCMSKVDEGIHQTSAGKFEEALKSLGLMLGADAHRQNQASAPDGVWVFGDYSVVIEAKSDAEPEGAVSVRVVRQALTHETRAKRDGLIPEGQECVTLLVTPQTRIDTDARKIAKDIRVVSPEEMVRLFGQTKSALGQVRTLAAEGSEDILMTKAVEIYARFGVSSDELVDGWFGKRLKDMD